MTNSKKITITMPVKTFERFTDFCHRYGMKYSTRISVLIEKDLREND